LAVLHKEVSILSKSVDEGAFVVAKIREEIASLGGGFQLKDPLEELASWVSKARGDML
jgi:hypothetical protein